MAGEGRVLNGVLDMLRQQELDWLIASVVNDWIATGLDAAIAEDGTVMAARQMLSLADTIQTSLVPQVDALAYLREVAPDSLFQDGLLPLDSARPIRQLDRPRASLTDVVGTLQEFIRMARDAVREEWPELQSALP